MPRIPVRRFDRGLWVNGANDQMPEATMRRLKGVHDNLDGLIRSIDPLALMFNLTTADAMVRFGTEDRLIWQRDTGTASVIHRDDLGGSWTLPTLPAALDRTRVTFHRADVTPGGQQYLFWAGGGSLQKMRNNGAVTFWGMTPPDGTQEAAASASKNAVRSKAIEDFEDKTTWGGVPSSPTLNDESTIKVEGTNSLRWDVDSTPPIHHINKALDAGTVDLNDFGTTGAAADESADQDHVELWVRFELDDPAVDDKNALADCNFMQLTFALNTTTFEDNVYFFRIPFEGEPLGDPQPELQTQREGLGQGKTKAEEREITDLVGEFAETKNFRDTYNLLGRTTLPRVWGVWIQLLLPKASFDRVGTDSGLDWRHCKAVQISLERGAENNRNILVYLDNMNLRGGAGLQGKYQYRFSYKSSTTGNRSNGNTTPMVVEDVQRHTVDIDFAAGAAPASNEGVDTIEIWRTVGNGALYFKAGEIDLNSDPLPSTFTDDVSDHPALWTRASTGDPITSEHDSLSSEELPENNTPPDDTFEFVVRDQFAGRTWWCGNTASGAEDRMYYSRAGYPESVDGFLETMNADDPVVAGVVWNDQLFFFTGKLVWRVFGEDEPFRLEQVWGAPGTNAPYTVKATPYGVVYQADDGIRIFDGAQARFLGHEPIAPLVRGQSVEGLAAFSGVVAEYAQDEYWISFDDASDGYVLVWTFRGERWRVLPVAQAGAMLCDPVDQKMVLATPTSIQKVDDGGSQTPMAFEVQTPSFRASVDADGVVQRFFVDIDTASQDVTPTLIYDDGTEEAFPAINTSSRETIECATARPTRTVALRLARTSPAAIIRLYGVEFDVYAPGAAA